MNFSSISGYVLIAAIFSSYCAYRQKRNPVIWFILGLCFDIYALIALALLPLLRKKSQAALAKNRTSSDPTTLEVTPSFSLRTTPEAMQKLWYFLDKERQTTGPMSFQLFYEQWKKGIILSDTLVWNETFSEWKTFKEAFPQQD
ncbi:MAG: DUF4339 domain-containing protein [Chlamydiae bacterium]|nr:DUF4339 domain-containing protein [Chlamydiota bacterium]